MTIMTDTLMHERSTMLSWRSIVGGTFVAFLTMTFFGALGMALGGAGLYDGTSLQNAGLFAGVGFLISVIISLFAGSYFAGRMCRHEAGRAGAAQGLVVASLLFAVIIYQAAATVGWIGSKAGSAVAGTASMAAQGAAQLTQSSMATQMIEDTMGNLNIPPERVQMVATGVASRVLSGNVDGAKSYLSRQTNITPAEASARIDAAQQRIEQAAVATREASARAMQATGWMLVALIALGTIAATMGGAMGARMNLRKPVGHMTEHGKTRFTEAYA